MRTAARSTRRTTTTQHLVGKENHAPFAPEDPTTPSKKARHRLSTAELARLEDVFRRETHPSRQQKKDLATDLGMDYKTVTIWFQNKRQTSKRGQPPVDRLDRRLGRARADSCLRTVSSPSHNATLDASGVGLAADASEIKSPADGLNVIAAKAIVKIKPLIDTLNALMSRPKGHPESMETKDEVSPSIGDTDSHWPQTSSENSIASAESSRDNQTIEKELTEPTKGKPVRWKRIRTLEWACERQAKRRKLSRDVYARLASEEAEGVQDHDGDRNEPRMDSALSLLSLASSMQVGPSTDVMRGASLLLSFKHSWRRK